MNFQDQQIIRSADTNWLELTMNVTVFDSKIKQETLQRSHLTQPQRSRLQITLQVISLKLKAVSKTSHRAVKQYHSCKFAPLRVLQYCLRMITIHVHIELAIRK